MKKITIFTCIGGHNTISSAIQNSLQKEYQVCVKNIFLDVLKPIDFVYFFTWGNYSTEDFYSYVIKKQWHKFMNIGLIKIGYSFFNLRKKRIYSLIFNHITQDSPDLIISVVPFFNNYFLKAAEELNIPFILMPTDIDLTTFLYKIDTIVYNKFHVALPLDNQESQKKLARAQMPLQHIHWTGAVLNEAFFKQQDINTIKKQFNICLNKPVILLLMGSQGSASLYAFARQLAQITTIPFHLIMVLGHNIQQKNELDTIAFPSTITYSIFGFTPYIPELMAISDLLITKSGGISMCEALYMNLPMLLDATTEVLAWERLNQAFVVNNSFGAIVHHIKSLPNTVVKLLSDNKTLALYKQNLMAFNKKNGREEIKKLINTIIS